jgi:hypothetical protein
MKKTFIILTIIAIAFGCSEEPGDLQEYYLFTTPENFILTINKDSIAADGKDFAEISIKVSDTVLQRYDEIEIEVSPVGMFLNNTSTISVPFNSEGGAMTGLYSEKDGKTIVTARIGVIKRTAEVEFYKINRDSLNLMVTSGIVPADNYSYAEIKAITLSRNGSGNQLVFSTDRGLFSNDEDTITVLVSSGDTTKVWLKSNLAGQARVMATYNNAFTEEISVTFTTSWPDQLIIDPDSSSLRPSFYAKSDVVAMLLKISGTVSSGQTVNFYDSTVTGQSVGSFLNTTLSNSDGQAKTEYWLQDTSYHGFVYIKGVIHTNEGTVLGMGKIFIR